MSNEIINRFEKMMKKQGVKFIICCESSPNNKCKGDLNGICYYCCRNMLNDTIKSGGKE